jgi:hypothetical protein
MKCLSLHQPLAMVMLLGVQRDETRSWRLAYCGPWQVGLEAPGMPQRRRELLQAGATKRRAGGPAPGLRNDPYRETPAPHSAGKTGVYQGTAEDVAGWGVYRSATTLAGRELCRYEGDGLVAV